MCMHGFLVLGVFLTDSFSATPLRVGVGVADITPPVGFRMSGYFHERLSTGVNDPLQAKAIVFTQNNVRAALLFCDLIGLPREISLAARSRIAERAGIPESNISICATHSHTGPLYFGALRQELQQRALAKHGRDPHEAIDYSSFLVDRLAQAAATANAAQRDVTLAAGFVRQQPTISFNRRFHMKDGSVRFNPGQLNPEIVRPAGPIDPDIGIILVNDAASQRTTALLSVFALHLDTVGSVRYSADFPFILETTLRNQLNPALVSLFGAGTCGDINHIDVTTKQRRTTQEIGRLLAENIIGGIGSLHRIAAPDLLALHQSVRVPLQSFTDREIAQAGKDMAKVGGRELPFLEQVRACKITGLQGYKSPELAVDVHVFRLAPDTAIVTLPGEVFVELGLFLKERSPFRNTLVIELANDAPGYIPTQKAFAEGSYETVNSKIRPGSAELMVEAALRLLRRAHEIAQ